MPASSTAFRLAAVLLLASTSATAHPWQDDAAASLPIASAALAPYVTYEAGPVDALLLAPDGRGLLALNTVDDRIEVYGVELAAATGRAQQPGSGMATSLPAPGGPSQLPGGGPALAPGALPALAWRGSIFAGLAPVAMALDPADSNRLFVSNHVSDSVSVVDLTRRQVVATIDVGDEPQGLLVTGGRIFVACARAPQTAPLPGQIDPGPLVDNVIAVHRAVAPYERLALLPLGAVRPRDLVLAGGLVYAIPQNSGNHTTLLDETAATNLGLEQLVLDAEDSPLPVNGVLTKPELTWPAYTRGWVIPVAGRIVRDSEYRALVPQLLDRDIIAIDPVALATLAPAVTGVGTTLLDIERNPATGELWVANSEAKNRLRWEPNLRGDAHEHRVTIVAPGGPVQTALELAPPLTTRPHAQPAVLEFSQGAAGNFAYVACLGSASVVVLDAVTRQLVTELDVGEIPSGLAADGARGILYVLSRGDSALRAFRIGGAWQPLVAPRPLPYDPEPPLAAAGRRHLYDARSSSGHGSDRLSCNTCHVFAHADQLAWDLGDPGGGLSYYYPDEMTDLAGFDGQIVTLPQVPILNPLKGPMVTQSLRGLLDPDSKDDIPGHWRGDRRTLHMFGPAFESLNGASAPLSRADMQEVQAFLRRLRYAPNPREPKNRVYTGQLAQGRDIYGLNPDVPGKEYSSGTGFLCANCHKADFAGETDFTGSRPTVSAGSFTQLFNTAHLRMIYEKDFKYVSGFGALHDGAVDGVRGFMDFSVPNGGLPTFSNFTTADKDAVAEFVKAFDTGFAPCVGQQFTLSPEALLAPGGAGQADAALDLLEQQARPTVAGTSPAGNVADDPAPDIDLIVKGFRLDTDGTLLPRSGIYGQNPADGAWGYFFDTGAFADRALLELIVSLGAATFTFTGVPHGQGARLGVDRDEDGLWELQETLLGTSPVLADTDGDGWLDGAELALGGQPLVPDEFLPDTTPPEVLGARALDIFADAATLTARTGEPARLRVELGLEPGGYGLATQEEPPELRCAHDVVFTGLPPGTTIHYRITATDRAGLTGEVTGSFDTLPILFHVQDITLQKSGAGPITLTARVLVRDQADAAAPAGVPVRAFWAGDLGGQPWEKEALTDATGWATFTLQPYTPAGPGVVTFSPIYIGSPFPLKPWFVGVGGDTPGHFYDSTANRASYREVSVP
jgi:YVTN family beta-propeller protein